MANQKHMKPLTYIHSVLFAVLWLAIESHVQAAPPVITNLTFVPSFTVQSDIGVTNQIQYSTNLVQSNWVALVNLLVVQSPYIYADISATSGPQRFYRVLELLPPASAATLSVAGFPTTQSAGVSGNFSVTVRDTNNAIVSGYAGTVHFSSTDPQATLPANYTFTTVDAGVHVFSATLKTVGIQSITASDTVASSINGSQTGITIVTGSASVLALNSGNNQVGAAGTQLANPLSVLVMDNIGDPVVGITVTWAASSGGGSVGNVSTVSNGSGVATTTATLGTSGGLNTFTATVAGLAGSPVTFSAMGAKNLAENIAANSNNQIGVAGTTLAVPLSVKVTDSAANPVSGITVTWAVSSGGGSVGNVSTVSNGSGVATTTATLGTSGGLNTFTATVAGLAGSPVTFSATGAKNLALNAGNNQTGTAGNVLAIPIAVKITDNAFNPVAGITVTWSVISGGGSVGNVSTVSNGSGVATTTATLGSTVGPNSFRATVTGMTGSPVSFSATGM